LGLQNLLICGKIKAEVMKMRIRKLFGLGSALLLLVLALCLGGCSVILTSDSWRRKEILELEVRVGGTGGGDTRE